MNSNKNNLAILLPILFGFFVMGFVDLVGVATAHAKQQFELSDSLSNIIPMMIFLWFFLCGVPTGVLMNKIGKRNTVLTSLIITLFSLVVLWLTNSFFILLFGFASLGIGNAILQIALNPMASEVVDKSKVASLLTLGQFVKASSSFLGPIIVGLALTVFSDWKMVFFIYAIITLVSLLWIYFALPNEKENQLKVNGFKETLVLLKDRYILILFLGILCAVGIDVGLNTYLPKLLMNNFHLTLSEAGYGNSLYFFAKMFGTFVGAILLAKVSSRKFYFVILIFSTLFFILLLCVQNRMGMNLFIVLLGLCCANFFSILFSWGLEYSPEKNNEVSALMIMGVSGGALFPPIMGLLSDNFGVTSGVSLLFLCLAFLLYIFMYKPHKL